MSDADTKEKDGKVAGSFAGKVTRRAALAGAAAAVVMGADWVVRGVPPQGEFSPLGNTDLAVKQSDVDLIYARLYERVAKEHEYAKQQGKDFVLLVGEKHQNADGLLVELMLADICKQRGVTQSVMEVQGRMLPVLREIIQESADSAAGDAQFIRGLNLQSRDVRRLLSALAISAPLVEGSKKATQDSSVRNPFFMLMHGDITRMKIIAADPANEQMKERFSETSENGMLHVLTATKGDRMAVFGAAHAARFKNDLKQDENLHVLAFDVSNVAFKHGSISALLQVLGINETLGRVVKPAGDLVIVEGRQLTHHEAFAMAVQACLNHRLKMGTLSHEDDVLAQEAMMHLVPETRSQKADILTR